MTAGAPARGSSATCTKRKSLLQAIICAATASPTATDAGCPPCHACLLQIARSHQHRRQLEKYRRRCSPMHGGVRSSDAPRSSLTPWVFNATMAASLMSSSSSCDSASTKYPHHPPQRICMPFDTFCGTRSSQPSSLLSSPRASHGGTTFKAAVPTCASFDVCLQDLARLRKHAQHVTAQQRASEPLPLRDRCLLCVMKS
jgi:hypothetical protein